MNREWYEIPVRVERDGASMVVPACEVQPGDRVWMDFVSYIVKDILADDEEGIMYIKINEIDAWPAAMFLSE